MYTKEITGRGSGRNCYPNCPPCNTGCTVGFSIFGAIAFPVLLFFIWYLKCSTRFRAQIGKPPVKVVVGNWFRGLKRQKAEQSQVSQPLQPFEPQLEPQREPIDEISGKLEGATKWTFLKPTDPDPVDPRTYTPPAHVPPEYIPPTYVPP